MNMINNPVLNPIESARAAHLARGVRLIELSDGNPTNHQLSLDWHDLHRPFRDYLNLRDYQPDSRGLLKARQAIADYYLHRTPSLDIAPDHIFIVSSTSEAYGLLMTLLCLPADTILEPQISYPLFELISDTHLLKRETYPHRPLDLPPITSTELPASLLKNAKALFTISPHNPSGRIWSTVDPVLTSSGIPIIVDEVFAEFTPADVTTPPLGVLYPNNPVFHLNGISKMCGLPDFKISWIALNDCASSLFAQRLEFLNDIYLNASYAIQHLLPDILKRREEYKQLIIERMEKNLFIFDSLMRPLPAVSFKRPEGGATIFPRLDIKIDQDIFLLSLLDLGISVHPGYYYNWEDDFRIVISLLLKPEIFEEGIEILRRLILACS